MKEQSPPTRIIAYIACSLDGYIAAPGGDVSWLNPYAAENTGVADFMRSVGVIALGRTTYDHTRKLGPPPKTSAQTVVLTHRPLPKDALADIKTMQGDTMTLASALRKLASPSEKDIWLMGGGRVIADFLDADQVDLLDIFVMPVLLGPGVPLFPARPPRQFTLSLQAAEPYANGIVRLAYSPVRSG